MLLSTAQCLIIMLQLLKQVICLSATTAPTHCHEGHGITYAHMFPNGIFFSEISSRSIMSLFGKYIKRSKNCLQIGKKLVWPPNGVVWPPNRKSLALRPESSLASLSYFDNYLCEKPMSSLCQSLTILSWVLVKLCPKNHIFP